MESGRLLLAIVLMVAVIVVTNLLFPPAPPPAPTGVEADTVTAVEAVPPLEAPAPAVEPAPIPTIAEALEPEGADTIVVASPLYRYSFSTRGAAVVGAEFLGFESFTDSGAVQLVPPGVPDLVSYGLRINGRVVDLAALPFEVEATAAVTLEPGGGERTINFVHRDPAGAFAIRIAYTADADNYLLRVAGGIEGLPSGAATQLLIGLGPTLAVNEARPEEDFRSLAYVVNSTRDGIRSVRLANVEGERIEEGPLIWVALKNKYFLAALIDGGASDGSFGGLIARESALENAADLTATLPVGDDRAFAFQLYLGPQEYDRLGAIGQGLEDVNPYGWKPFRPIIRPLARFITWALVEMHRAIGIGYGWVLILFGVLVRIALWPLNARAMRSQMKNMVLQPRMQEIQKKYKNDPEKLQREMLRLYREEGFNPLGGCLPMLIPFPVLITLFFVFQNTIEFRGVEFLWLPDLARPDPYYVLPILLGLSMFLMQRISAAATPPNPQMKMMLYFMPAFMVIIFLNFASGLNLYYAAQNVASIPQQVLLTRERKKHPSARR